MLKTTLFAFALLTTPVVYSKGSSQNHESPVRDNSGIVTPEVATGVLYTHAFYRNANGEMVVCLNPNEYIGKYNQCNVPDQPARLQNTGWTLATDSIPKGRKYVGFRLTRGSHNTTFLEIYWK